MRRRSIALVAVLAVGVLAAVGLFVWPGHLLGGGKSAPTADAQPSGAPATAAGSVKYSPGVALPAAALADCQLLVSSSATTQRSALAPSSPRRCPPERCSRRAPR